MFYARLADRYLKNNEVAQAVEYAEKAALMHPHDVTAKFVLAKCNYVKQDFEKAEKNLTDVLTLDPQHQGALNLQTELFADQGATDKAKENINHLIDLDPLNEDIHLKNIVFPKADQPSAKEAFEDEWNAALLPEDERPPAKFNSEFDRESHVQPDEQPAEDFEFDSNWEPEKIDDFDLEQETEYFKDESISDESFPEEELEDQPLRDDSFHDDPFADFEETPSFDETEPAVDEQQDENNAVIVDEPTAHNDQDDKYGVDEYSGDEILDESVDDDFEIDKRKFKEEKSKFTRLLDDIFSTSLDEEEQRENEQRSTIERIADSAPQIDEPPEDSFPPDTDDDFEPLMSRDDIIFPEEKILESDRHQQDEPFEFDNVDDTPEKSKPDMSEDFNSFLDSLDIKDDSQARKEKELPDQFDDPLPKMDDDFAFSDDLKNILEPLSASEDWTQDLSDAASEESFPEEESTVMDSEPEDESNDVPHESKSAKDDKGKFYTPTLGEIYAAQGQYAKAISVYENLLKHDPDNDMYQSKLALFRKKLAEQQ